MKKVTFLFLFIFIFLFSSGFGCKRSTTAEKIRQSLPDITLNYWRVFDNFTDFSDLTNSYKVDHPNISINYRKLRFEEYKKELIEAWSEDRGPDIFSIPTTWLGEYITKNRLQEMPAATTMTYEIIVNEKKGEKDYISKVNKSPTLNDIKLKYVDVVYNDVVRNKKVYGLPLAIDTLVLYYNRDLLNYARIAEPPLTWSQFKEDVKKLSLIDKKGNIIQAGTSMGLVQNVARSFDIVSLLMMQNGSPMECGENFCVGGDRSGFNPGMEAIVFYTDFANPNKEIYTWNQNMPDSIDAFADGKLVYLFGYSYHKEQIRAKNPSLNYYVSTVPQIDGTNKEVNFANYFIEVVAKKSTHQNEAWDFVKYITDEKNVMSYLKNVKKPTALRSLIGSQSEDPELAPFVKQALTAKDWYHGKDYNKAEEVLNNLVLDVLNKSEEQTLDTLEEKANKELDMTW